MKRRSPNTNEIAAMWHFHDRYGAQNKGAVDFWLTLSLRERDFIIDMVTAIREADRRYGQAD